MTGGGLEFIREVISPKVIEFMPDVQFGAKTLKIQIYDHLTSHCV